MLGFARLAQTACIQREATYRVEKQREATYRVDITQVCR